MTTVFNSTDLLNRFKTLGWTSSQQDLLQAVETSGVAATVVVAYLDALIAASPGGLNDQTISGVTAAQGTAITSFLKARGLLAQMVVAVDWDDTLVDVHSQEWLPDAKRALKVLRRRGHTVIVHSSRANTPGGKAHIEKALAAAGFAFRVEPKLLADLYVDNLAAEFDGDWSATLRELRGDRK